jgi:hypothetical protein
MLSKKIALALYGFSLITTLSSADPCGTALGNTTIEKATLQCLDLTGKGIFNMATMLGKLTIVGSLDATKSTFNTLDVTGNVTLQFVTVGGNAKIIGALNATDSSFLADLVLNTQTVNLTRTNAKNITLNTERDHEVPVFVITDSTITGNITFSSGNGIVQNHNSKITGKVIGGKIQP